MNFVIHVNSWKRNRESFLFVFVQDLEKSINEAPWGKKNLSHLLFLSFERSKSRILNMFIQKIPNNFCLFSKEIYQELICLKKEGSCASVVSVGSHNVYSSKYGRHKFIRKMENSGQGCVNVKNERMCQHVN